MDIRFRRCGVRPDGEALYRMEIDGRVTTEGLTLDEVIAAINKEDEERLGEEHAPGRTDCHTSAAALVRNDGSPAERRRRADRRPGAKR